MLLSSIKTPGPDLRCTGESGLGDERATYIKCPQPLAAFGSQVLCVIELHEALVVTKTIGGAAFGEQPAGVAHTCQANPDTYHVGHQRPPNLYKHQTQRLIY